MQDRLGKFQILRTLGKGAMGEVYLAQDTVLGREVAIKTILAGSAFGAEARARFEREARVTSTLNHPNIVTVFEFGEADGVHYLVLEYVEGENLELLIAKQSLPKAELLEILAQVCDALAFSHDHGVIHRDIKPANVLVSSRGRKLQAKLMDFGVALVDRSNLTQGGVWMGTVNYMAPEYLDTGKAGPQSDLFAVGVILYETLTGGRKPFTGDTTTGVLNAILRQPAAPIRPEEVEGLDPSVLALVKKALAKDPADRFGCAEELATALRAVARAERTFAPPKHALVIEGHAPAVAAPRVPSDRILVVGRGGKAHCLSLRVALRQAEPGNQIVVLPGTYREGLIIDKPVSIRGDGEGVVLAFSAGVGIQIRCPGVTLAGLTLQREGTHEEPLLELHTGQATLTDSRILDGRGLGAQVKGAGSSLRLEHCIIEGSGEIGVAIEDGAQFSALGCTWSGWQRAGLLVSTGASAMLTDTQIHAGLGVGVWAQGSAQVTLERVDVIDREAGGLEAEGDARIIARQCRILGSRFAGILALPKAQVNLEDVEISGHAASGIHAVGAVLQFRMVRVVRNGGFGCSFLEGTLANLEGGEISQNGASGLYLHQGTTAQLKACKISEGLSLGIACTTGARGVLEACEISGNAQSGAQVEPGGSLLLVRCVLRDGRDTGLLLFEDAQATLEECVVHRNARGGILLTKDASDPIIRGGSAIEDDLFRANAQGGLVKLTPLKKR